MNFKVVDIRPPVNKKMVGASIEPWIHQFVDIMLQCVKKQGIHLNGVFRSSVISGKDPKSTVG